MRHKKIKKRQINPDKIYKSRLVAKFINNLMKDGKKTVAEKNFYQALKIISDKGKNALQVFEKSISNVEPKQEVKARRVGGASYQVPVEVKGDRRTSLAIRWIIQAALARPNKEFHTMSEKLAAEFLDAVENKGEAIKKRDITHRMAEANKAFAHFKW